MARKTIGATLVLSGEKEFNKAVRDTNQNIKLLSSELKKNSTEFSNNSKSLQALDARYNLHKKLLDELKTKEEVQRKALENSQTQYQKASVRVEELKEKLNSARSEMEQMTSSSETTKSELKNQEDTIKSLEKQLEQAEKRYTSTEGATKRWETALNNTKTEILKTEQSLQELGQEIFINQSRMYNFGQSAQTAATHLDSIANKANTVGNALTIGLTAPLAAGVGFAVKAMDEVDEGLDTVMTKTGATGQAAKELDQVYRSVANEIPGNFADIGAAVGELNTRLGFTDNKLKSSSEQFLKFAKVNDTDVNQSVQLVTRAMKDAEIENENYGDLLDDLTVAAQISGISIDSLTTNLAKYGAPMRALGLDTQYSIAMFAGWEKAGVNTEITFSGMRKAISTWSKEGKDARVEFAKTMDEIKAAPDIAQATTIAIEAFGQKAGPDLADAIRGGRFEVDEYIQALSNSDGAVNNTYKMIVDEVDDTQLAMQRLKLSMHDLGETIAKTVGPVFLDVVNDVKQLFEWFGNLEPKTQKLILQVIAGTAAAGPLIKVGSQGIKIIGSLTDKVGKLSVKLTEKKAAKVATENLASIGSAATKSTKEISGISAGIGKFGSALSSIAGPAGIAVGAATATGVAIVGIGSAIDKLEEKYVKADLAKRFGDISLSAEEIDKAVEQLTKNGNVDAAKTKLEQLADTKEKLNDLNTTVEELEKQNYLIQIGVGMNEEDTANFQNNINTLISQAQEIVNQTKIQIPMQLDFLSSTDISGIMSGFSAYESQVNSIAQTLNSSVAKALEDGIVTAEESMDIQPMIQRLQEKVNVVADAEYTAKLDKISVDAGDLTPESYADFIEKFQETTNEQIQTLEDNQYQTEVLLNVLLGEGIIDQTKYDQFLEQSRKELENQKMEITVGKGIEYTLSPIRSRYAEELKKASREMYDDTKTIINGVEMDLSEAIKDGSAENLNNAFNGMYTEISQGFANLELDDGARDAIAQLYDQLQPTKEQLESIAQSAREAGDEVPGNVLTALSDINNLGAIAGAEDSIWYMIGQKAQDDPAVQEMLIKMQERGVSIPTALADSIRNNSSLVYDATVFQWKKIEEASANTPITGAAAENVKKMRNVVISEIGGLSQETINSLGVLGIDVNTSMLSNLYMLEQNGGIAIERGANGEITKFISGVTGAVEENTPELESLFASTGVAANEAMGNKLVEQDLELPDIDPMTNEEATDIMEDTHNKLQVYANGHPVQVPIEMDPSVYGQSIGVEMTITSADIKKHAAGGIVNRPELALIGEAGPEVVIPLAQNAPWIETLSNSIVNKVGYIPHVPDIPTPSRTIAMIDYDILADKLAAALRKAPLETHVETTVKNNLSVDLDGELVGRAVSPTVSRIISKNF